jgi:hypothetical protein
MRLNQQNWSTENLRGKDLFYGSLERDSNDAPSFYEMTS